MDAAGLTCQTAPSVVFASMDDMKAHYKSDWHRYNLKRKVAGLPMVGRELFERVVSHAMRAEEAERATSTSHLKPDKPRQPARHTPHLDDEDEDDESDDEWEEVHGAEAEAVALQLSQRRSAHTRQPAPAQEASDEDMEEQHETDAAAFVALAGNGVELVVGNHILGAREFARYYRQRPRPVDSRAVTVAAAGASSREHSHALVAQGHANGPSYRGPAVTRQHARVQRVEQRTSARLRMITEMNANGPQFRGYRE